jgi:hypothetical protein
MARIARSRFPYESARVRCLQKSTGLLSGEPTSKPDNTQLLGPFHSSDADSKFRTGQAGIGGLVYKSSDYGESSIDRSRGEMAVLKENAVTSDRNLVERQSWLGTTG